MARAAMRSAVLGARAEAAEARLNSARAVTNTRESRVTMRKATEGGAAPSLSWWAVWGLRPGLGTSTAFFASGYSGCSPGAGSDPCRARYLSPLPTASGAPLDFAGELAHRVGESFGFPVHPRSVERALERARSPKADERDVAGDLLEAGPTPHDLLADKGFSARSCPPS